MLPSTATSGADPDCHHHCWLQLLTQWHLHHRGSCHPNQDLHLWVFKGRSSSTWSAQTCVFALDQAGLGRPGQGLQNEHQAPWLKLRVCQRVRDKKLKNKKLVFFLLRWQTMGQQTKMAQLCPVLQLSLQRPPVAPQLLPLPLTFQRSVQSLFHYYLDENNDWCLSKKFSEPKVMHLNYGNC